MTARRLQDAALCAAGALALAVLLRALGPALDEPRQQPHVGTLDTDLTGALALWDVEARHACAARATQAGPYIRTNDGAIQCADDRAAQLVAQGGHP